MKYTVCLDSGIKMLAASPEKQTEVLKQDI